MNTTDTTTTDSLPTPPETQTQSAPEAASPSAGEEQVRKIYAKDVREKDRLSTVFLVTRKVRHTARSGKVLLQVGLADKTGELDARIFDQVDTWEPTFSPGDYVLVHGMVGHHHGKAQLVIERLEKLDPTPLDKAEFTPPPPESKPEAKEPAGPSNGAQSVAKIREIVDRVQDPFIKTLLVAFLEDAEIAKGLPLAPAAKGIHHAYRGGLADHILSVMKLAHRMADHYPMVDRDLLIAGALLHDIGKVQELSYERNYDYTDEGRLVGHLVMTAQMIREKSSQIPRFPKLLEQHITHLVLAHHGQLEYGSPKLPLTLEAYIVHMIDSLDSRVASWLELMAKDSNEKWTEVSRLYERHLWKGVLPTSRNRGPVEPRAPGQGGQNKKRDRKKGQGPHAHSQPAAAKAHAPEGSASSPHAPSVNSPARAKPPPKEGKPGTNLPKELTFKPFSTLATISEEKPSNSGEASTAE